MVSTIGVMLGTGSVPVWVSVHCGYDSAPAVWDEVCSV